MKALPVLLITVQLLLFGCVSSRVPSLDFSNAGNWAHVSICRESPYRESEGWPEEACIMSEAGIREVAKWLTMNSTNVFLDGRDIGSIIPSATIRISFQGNNAVCRITVYEGSVRSDHQRGITSEQRDVLLSICAEHAYRITPPKPHLPQSH